MSNLSKLRVKLFADGADKPGMLSLYANPLIKGLTTNPTLMKKAGITNFEAFAKDILQTSEIGLLLIVWRMSFANASKFVMPAFFMSVGFVVSPLINGLA